jgi:hypothetical protein
MYVELDGDNVRGLRDESRRRAGTLAGEACGAGSARPPDNGTQDRPRPGRGRC